MKRISRLILIGMLALIVLTSACNLPAQIPPTPPGTPPSVGEFTGTPSPTNTLSNETATPFIPITGMDVVSLQCQFCVNDEAHAVLIMSKLASFNVADPATAVTCLTAQETTDRRILLCRGAQESSFNLNVCVGNENCLQFAITLQTCPLIPQTGTGTPVITFTPFAPILLTPRPGQSTPVPGPTQPETSPAPTTETTAPTPQPTIVTTEPPPEPTQITTEPPPQTSPPASSTKS
jgi:hypothetical protein